MASIGNIMATLFGGTQPQAAPPPNNMGDPAAQQQAMQQPNANPQTGKLPDGNNSTLEQQNQQAQQTQQQTQQEVKTTPAEPTLDTFKDLWNNVQNPNANSALKDFNPDPAKIREAFSKADFTKGIDPQVLAKARGGDDVAFAQVLNAVSQNSAANVSYSMTQVIKQLLEKNNESLNSSLPEKFRQFQAQDGLITQNPLLNHPATKPLLDAMIPSLRAKFPEASTQEIQDYAVNYIKQFASAVAKPAEDGDTQAGKSKTGNQTGRDIDWVDWATSGMKPN